MNLRCRKALSTPLIHVRASRLPVNKSEMPKGVEHEYEKSGVGVIIGVNESEMPKGVEHNSEAVEPLNL